MWGRQAPWSCGGVSCNHSLHCCWCLDHAAPSIRHSPVQPLLARPGRRPPPPPPSSSREYAGTVPWSCLPIAFRVLCLCVCLTLSHVASFYSLSPFFPTLPLAHQLLEAHRLGLAPVCASRQLSSDSSALASLIPKQASPPVVTPHQPYSLAPSFPFKTARCAPAECAPRTRSATMHRTTALPPRCNER